MTSYVQEFGYLIVLNTKFKIVGLSNNALKQTSLTKEDILGESVNLFFRNLFSSDQPQLLHLLGQLITSEIPRQVITKKIADKLYYFKLSYHDDKLFVEWEEQQKKLISASKMNELGFLFEQSYSLQWKYVCQGVNKLLNFDRIIVLQVFEAGHSKIIEEYSKNKKRLLGNQTLSPSFMPASVISYYQSLPYRYVPNVNKLQQEFFHAEDMVIDLMPCQLKKLPDIHELYLKSKGICSVLFFPLFMDGVFWGMITAQNEKERLVDLQTRKLCSFIIQNAMNKYENLFKQGLLDTNKQLQEAESTIKNSLASLKTVNCAITSNLDLLRQMTDSDGIAVYNHGDVFFDGLVPSKSQFHEIVEYIKENKEKAIYKDYNFAQKHKGRFSQPLNFAGLLSLQTDSDKNYYIVWFRKEKVSNVLQMEVIESALNNDEQTLHIWDNEIADSALPWDENAIQFVQSLQQIINESILKKIRERELITDNLLSLNNELEMFTYTLSHDLKNPLTVLQMGLQFLHTNGHNLSLEKQLSWYKNLLDSVTNIEDIIDNIVLVSQSRSSQMDKDPIPMSYMINKIIKDVVLLFQASHCQINMGNLLPIWGEKSALYQIFINLLGNAVKYSATKQNPEIHIDSQLIENHIEYKIRDNGIGIPKKDLPQIFEMFTRGGNAQHLQGTGIGLSLVHRIMDRLGGAIVIESQENEGTEIRIRFPMVSDFPLSIVNS